MIHEHKNQLAESILNQKKTMQNYLDNELGKQIMKTVI